MEPQQPQLARLVAKLAGSVALLSFLGLPIAIRFVSVNGSYGDEYRVLLLAIVLVFSLIVCGIAWAFSAESPQRDQPAFEVLPPREAKKDEARNE